MTIRWALQAQPLSQNLVEPVYIQEDSDDPTTSFPTPTPDCEAPPHIALADPGHVNHKSCGTGADHGQGSEQYRL